jgi:hypothetical protein
MNIEQRLAAVEDRQRDLARSLGRWRLACAGLAIAAVGMIVVAAGPDGGVAGVPDVIQARKFEVVDGNGKSICSIEQVAGNGELHLHGRDGSQVEFFTAPDGGEADLSSPDRDITISSSSKSKTGGMIIWDSTTRQKLWTAP